MAQFIKRHPNVSIAVLLLVVDILLFAPYLTQPDSLMWPRSGLGSDMLTYNWPAVQFFREAVRETGQLPLWQNTSAGGQPMIGNPAIRVFYPPQLVMSLLPIPILLGYALLNVFHFWLAGIGGYGLARSVLKLDYPAALLAGLLVMLTPRLSSNVVGDVGYTYGLCWLPLCLLWMRLAFDRLSWRWAIATGLALCCIYLTNIQFILYAGWFVGLYFVYCCVEFIIKRSSRRVWIQHIGMMLIIGVSFIGFSAFQSFTFASYLPYQTRQAMTLADANYLALPPIVLMNTMFPLAQKFPEWEIYAGLLPLIFAPLAILYHTRREVGWWLGVFIFAGLFSLGSVTPLYTLMFYGVPGFNLLRVPARMWFVAAIALALLTAVAVDGLLHERKLSRWAWRWLGGSTLLLVVVTLGGRFITRQAGEMDWLIGFFASAGVILSLIGLWFWLRGRLSTSVFAIILAGAVIIDLFPLDMTFGTPRPINDFLQVPPIVQSMMHHASSNDDLYRVYSTRREISDAVAVANDLQTVDGLNSFQFASYAQFIRVASGCDLKGIAAATPPCTANEISDTAWLDAVPDAKLLGLVNTRYVITSLDLSSISSLKQIDVVGDSHLYENSAAQPRAFTVGRAELFTGAMSAYLPELGQRAIALLDSGQDIQFDLPMNDFSGSAQIVRYTPNNVQIQAEMPTSGLLVLGDTWIPGWMAYVDDQPVVNLRVDGALRGVYLTAGSHKVMFEFRPPAFVIGLIVTIATILIVSGFVLFYKRRESSLVI